MPFSSNIKKYVILPAVLCVWAVPAFAEGARLPSSISNPFVTLMIIVIACLALIIGLMAKLAMGAAALYLQKQKTEEAEKNNTAAVKSVTVLLLVLCSVKVFAEAGTGAAPATAAGNFGGISETAYYLLCGVVFIELLVVGILLYMLRVFTAIQKKQKPAIAAGAVKERKPFVAFWDRMNKFKPLHEESTIELDHNYDGIRELDNRLPPWWLYGFYCTIVFAFVYFYMHEVSHSAPSGIEEYQMAVAKADEAKAEYLKKAANNVDENTVKMLTDEASLTAGKNIFQTTCFACHGKLGEGGVGPNLTDGYWLHGGTVSDVFKTIKYGWADKGMKSWKDDFSPVQIAQITSYVKSLAGSNPPNGKAPQGSLFTDDKNSAKDSVVVPKKM